MRDEEPEEEDEDGNIIDYDGGICTAVNAWSTDPAAAKARYGPIASWDTSGITDMYMLFSKCGCRSEKDLSELNGEATGALSCKVR